MTKGFDIASVTNLCVSYYTVGFDTDIVSKSDITLKNTIHINADIVPSF